MSLEDICAKKDEAIDKQKATEALREEAEARYETQVQRVAKLEAEVAELQQSAASVREDKARMSTELDVSRQATREVKLEMESLMSNLAQQRASNLEVPRGHCQCVWCVCIPRLLTACGCGMPRGTGRGVGRIGTCWWRCGALRSATWLWCKWCTRKRTRASACSSALMLARTISTL